MERAPVDRHREPWSEEAQRLGGSFGIQVTFSESRSPAGDREQSEVEARREARHLVEEIGIACEVDAAATVHGVPDRLGGGPVGSPPAVMYGRDGRDLDTVDLHCLPDGELGHVLEAVVSCERRTA